MGRGPQKESVEVLGWMMKPKKDLKTTDETLYYCVERDKKAKCPAAYAINNTNHNIRIIRNHMNHEIDYLKNETTFARQELKRTANDGPCRDVIDNVRQAYGPRVSLAMGDYNAKRRIVNDAKAKSEPDTSQMNAGGPIADSYAKTIDGNRFLISDHLHRNNRFLLFGSDIDLELLSNSKVLMVDGTFDSVPDGFLQLFTFHVYISEHVVRPVLYALLPNKQLDTYEHIISELKGLPELKNWDPDMIISGKYHMNSRKSEQNLPTDFEISIKTAFENAFPNATMHGCLFHLIQSWRKHAESLKVYDSFITGPFQEFWQLLKVLPYIDAVNIEYYYGIIINTLPLQVPDELNRFIEYIQKYYVSGTNTSSPRFPPSIWSCSLQVVNSIHRTTNTVECWHRLLGTVTTCHNNLTSLKLSDLLKKIRMEDAHTKADAAELKINPNFEVKKSRKIVNIEKDRKLKKAVENNPAAPLAPLTDLNLLNAFVFATK